MRQLISSREEPSQDRHVPQCTGCGSRAVEINNHLRKVTYEGSEDTAGAERMREKKDPLLVVLGRAAMFHETSSRKGLLPPSLVLAAGMLERRLT